MTGLAHDLISIFDQGTAPRDAATATFLRLHEALRTGRVRTAGLE